MRRSSLAGAAAVLAIVVMCASPALAQQVGTPPVASVQRGQYAAGDKMILQGQHWPDGNVAVSICGNNAVNGTPDCDQASSRVFAVSKGGGFAGTLNVALPPAPCPCVVFVRSVAEPAQFMVPVTLTGASESSTPPVRHQPTQTVLQVTTKEVRGPLWREAFGIQPSRAVVFTITNTGTRPSGPGTFDVTFGKGKVPTGFGASGTFPSIDAGQKTDVRVDFPLDAISFGSYNIRVRVDSPYGHAERTDKVSVQPWGLGVVVVAAVILADVLLVRHVRRRRRSNPPPQIDPDRFGLPPGPPVGPVDATGSDAVDERVLVSSSAAATAVTERIARPSAWTAQALAYLTDRPPNGEIDLPALASDEELVAWGAALNGAGHLEAPSISFPVRVSEPLVHAVPVVAAAAVAGASRSERERFDQHVDVEFRLHGHDDARSVAVCGEFNEWSPAADLMERTTDGWVATVTVVRDRRYRYRFLVDGISWIDDPSAAERVPNEFGTEDCVVEVRDDPGLPQPMAPEPPDLGIDLRNEGFLEACIDAEMSVLFVDTDARVDDDLVLFPRDSLVHVTDQADGTRTLVNGRDVLLLEAPGHREEVVPRSETDAALFLVNRFAERAQGSVVRQELTDRNAVSFLLDVSAGAQEFAVVHAPSARAALLELRENCARSSRRYDVVDAWSQSFVHSLVVDAVPFVVELARSVEGAYVRRVYAVETVGTCPEAAREFELTEILTRVDSSAPLLPTGNLPLRATSTLRRAGFDARVLLGVVPQGRTS